MMTEKGTYFTLRNVIIVVIAYFVLKYILILSTMYVMNYTGSGTWHSTGVVKDK